MSHAIILLDNLMEIENSFMVDSSHFMVGHILKKRLYGAQRPLNLLDKAIQKLERISFLMSFGANVAFGDT